MIGVRRGVTTAIGAVVPLLPLVACGAAPGAITRYPVSGQEGDAYWQYGGMVTGPDGHLWLVVETANSIYRITVHAS